MIGVFERQADHPSPSPSWRVRSPVVVPRRRGSARSSGSLSVVPRWWPDDGVHGCPQRFPDDGIRFRPAEMDDRGRPRTPTSRPGSVGVRATETPEPGCPGGTWGATKWEPSHPRLPQWGRSVVCAASGSWSEGSAAVGQDHVLMCWSGLSHDEADRKAPTGIVGQLLVFQEVLVWRRLRTVSAFVTTA